jgi:hypothetical protein
MKRWICSSVSLLMFVASSALAEFHLFQIEQLFSNADGTVQFVVMHEFTGSNGEHRWAGKALISTSAGVNKTFVFPNNLGSTTTANRRVLIATQGFAAMGIVTPDYTMPNGFLPTNGGTLNFAGVDSVTFASLPTDGTTAINRNGGMIPNLATNFAGQSGSVTAAPSAIIPVAGVWWNPNESGSGFGLDYQNGTLLVEVYSYLAGGASQWYLAAGPVANNVFTATLDKYTGGQCISCAYKAPGLVGNDGTITITFTSPTTATADLPGGRHIQIERFFPSLPVAGAFIPVPGVWWNPNESGSGLGIDYENGTLIVEVYSYLAGGASQWYLAAGPVTNNVFTATLDKYTGGQCISCAYVAPALVGNDGTITITFTSPTTATADLPGGRHIQIQRFFQ